MDKQRLQQLAGVLTEARNYRLNPAFEKEVHDAIKAVWKKHGRGFMVDEGPSEEELLKAFADAALDAVANTEEPLT